MESRSYHKEMANFKKQAEHSHGRKRQQLLKHYHRMKKELEAYNRYRGGRQHE